MFRFLVVLAVLTMMPAQYHSLGLNFLHIIDSGNHTAIKGFYELCQHFCDEEDYSEDLFEGLLDDEPQPRILCWICHKKGFPTKKPTPTTSPTKITPTKPTPTTTPPTKAPTEPTPTTTPPTKAPTKTTTTPTTAKTSTTPTPITVSPNTTVPSPAPAPAAKV